MHIPMPVFIIFLIALVLAGAHGHMRYQTERAEALNLVRRQLHHEPIAGPETQPTEALVDALAPDLDAAVGALFDAAHPNEL